MKRGRPKLKLMLDAPTAEKVRQRFRQSRDVKEKERLQAVLLAMDGQHSFEQIATLAGRARSLIQKWIDRMEEGGLEALLERKKAPGKPSPLQAGSVQEPLLQGLKEGRWRTARQMAAWLEKEHGIRRAIPTMYYWLGKVGGALKVPRPVHEKKSAEAAEAFKGCLYEKLSELNLPEASRVRVGVTDECRYGLHSVQRRCWGLRGVRVIKPKQQQYEWGCVHGALDVVGGDSFFLHLPSVSLELSELFLQKLAASDPASEHVVIWDGAGFHHEEGDKRLPASIHVLPLPAYSPELNPVEKVWDMIQDELCNRVYKNIKRLDEAVGSALQPFIRNVARIRSLVGDGWLHAQANASSAILYH